METPIEIAKSVLRLEADSISNLMNHLGEEFEKAVHLIMERKGRLIILGVGKSGHIGKKIAATFASTGQPSFFVHPTEARHGDLGMIVSGDSCLMISHSGNTNELVELVPAVKRIGLPIIAVTSNPDSKLAKYADVVLNTHVREEACPFNLAPTSSTTATLAFGDAMAITLLKLRGFKEEQFAMWHPGGTLGKRLLTRVSDIMITENMPVNRERDSFREALATMTRCRQGVTVLVDDDRKCVGILTDGDLRRIFETHDKVSDIELAKVCTKNPKTISKDALAVEALKHMQDRKITSLIAVDEELEIKGLIHIHHLLAQGFY